jgi:hypothetical protein
LWPSEGLKLGEIRLVTREESFKRARKIAGEYEAIYGRKFRIEKRFLPIDLLVPTQKELSENKLLVVLQEIKHGYDAPVIVISYTGRYYILDGHHRAFALWKLGFSEVEALIIKNGEDFTPGVIETVEKSGIKSLKDVKIVKG